MYSARSIWPLTSIGREVRSCCLRCWRFQLLSVTTFAALSTSTVKQCTLISFIYIYMCVCIKTGSWIRKVHFPTRFYRQKSDFRIKIIVRKFAQNNVKRNDSTLKCSNHIFSTSTIAIIFHGSFFRFVGSRFCFQTISNREIDLPR